MNNYRPWRDLNKEERKLEKWRRQGRPVIIWPSKILGTFVKDNEECGKKLKEYLKLMNYNKTNVSINTDQESK